MFWGMAFTKVEFTILLMGVFYNSLKSLRALVCEREKKLIYYSLWHRFPTKKSTLQKKKCLKVNTFSLADAKTYIYCLLLCDITYWFCEQWATMYEFNLHNILYRRKKCVCPSSVIFFFLNNLDLLRLWLFRKLFHIWTSWMLTMPFWNSSSFATKPHDSPLEIAQLDIEQITGTKTEMSS